MAAKAPVHLMLFDVVFLDTSRLTRTPYSERRAVLESLDLGGPAWSVPAAVVGHGRRALEMTRTAGFEGIVAKRRTSLYEPGARSRAWIKIRHVRTEDIVVGGWLPGHGRLTSLPGALLMGRPAPGGDSVTSAAWAPAGATTNAPPSQPSSTPRRPTSVRSPSGPRWPAPGGWRPGWSERSATRPAPGPDACASPPGTACGPTSHPMTSTESRTDVRPPSNNRRTASSTCPAPRWKA